MVGDGDVGRGIGLDRRRAAGDVRLAEDEARGGVRHAGLGHGALGAGREVTDGDGARSGKSMVLSKVPASPQSTWTPKLPV